MIRNVKTLGLAIVAVLAMSAVVASAAQAADHLRIGNGEKTGKVTLTTHPNKTTQHFETDVGAINCKEFAAHYEGNKTITASPVTLTGVEYKSCTLGGLKATVNFGTCDYTLSNPVTTIAAGHAQGNVTIGPVGCTVTIKSTVIDCTVTVAGGQTFENAITYTQVKTNEFEEITGHANAPGIAYSYSGTACGTGSNTNGVYEGTFTAKGSDTGGAPLDLTLVET